MLQIKLSVLITDTLIIKGTSFISCMSKYCGPKSTSKSKQDFKDVMCKHPW